MTELRTTATLLLKVQHQQYKSECTSCTLPRWTVMPLHNGCYLLYFSGKSASRHSCESNLAYDNENIRDKNKPKTRKKWNQTSLIELPGNTSWNWLSKIFLHNSSNCNALAQTENMVLKSIIAWTPYFMKTPLILPPLFFGLCPTAHPSRLQPPLT